VGALMAAPRAPLARRFGRSLLLRLDQAFGHVEEALSPRLPVPELSAERRLAEPIVDMEDIERIILILARSLRDGLEQRGAGALAVQLLLFRVDSAVTRLSVGLSGPARAPERIGKLFHERLDAVRQELDAGYGFDLVRLSVLSVAPLPPVQGDLGKQPAEAGSDLSEFVDRVGARFGRPLVRRPAAVASHLPERAAALSPFAPDTLLMGLDRMATGSLPERPLRLLSPPEPIEVIAPVPDGAPLNFRWRRAQYRIVGSEGPERIEPEWWREDLPVAARGGGEKDPAHEGQRRRAIARRLAFRSRDYFRVEDADGRRFWLYRQGLYGLSEGAPRWFLHGLFA
jgi:protein ImuB